MNTVHAELRQQLIAYMFGHDIPSLADSATHPIALWLTSDATVELLAVAECNATTSGWEWRSETVRASFRADARDRLRLLAAALEVTDE